MTDEIHTTRLEDAVFELEGQIEAYSEMGMLHIMQDAIGQVKLSPRAQYDLLEWLYQRRAALYHATHLAIGNAPEWIEDTTPSKIVEAD